LLKKLAKNKEGMSTALIDRLMSKKMETVKSTERALNGLDVVSRDLAKYKGLTLEDDPPVLRSRNKNEI
jgi:hypothetical protein